MAIFFTLIDKICLPNPQVYKNETERTALFRHNKKLFYTITSAMLILLINHLLSGPDVGVSSSLWVFIGTKWVLFCLTCRSYVELYSNLMMAFVTLLTPISRFCFHDSVYSTQMYIYIAPLWTLSRKGTKLFVFQSFVQIIFFHYFFKEQLIETLQFVDLEYFAKRLVNIHTLGILIFTAQVLSIQDYLIKAQTRIAQDKARTELLEREKHFLLSFSHEIRNLVHTMIGSIQLCIQEKLPEKAIKLLEGSEVCGEVLIQLINNILDTGKTEVGELEITPNSTILDETLEKVWRVCARLIENKHLNGHMRLQKGLPFMVKIDHYRLMQILINLVRNAIKTTEKGEIDVCVEWISEQKEISDECFEPHPFDEEDEGLFIKNQTLKIIDMNYSAWDLHMKKYNVKTVESNSCRSAGLLKLVITDNGRGISEDKISRLFNRQDQPEDTLDTRLELFITKQIIEKMGGEIRVFSKLGKGTSFIIILPVEPVALSPRKSVSKEMFIQQIKNANLKAMVVDDVDFNHLVIGNTLSKLNVQVSAIARNGEEAFEKFKANIKDGNSFDIITMDVDMPVMDGKKSMKLIREYERTHNMQPSIIIMISGNCSETEIEECIGRSQNCMSEKANDFLKKPASIDEIYESIKRNWKVGVINYTQVNKIFFGGL